MCHRILLEKACEFFEMSYVRALALHEVDARSAFLVRPSRNVSALASGAALPLLWLHRSRLGRLSQSSQWPGSGSLRNTCGTTQIRRRR